MPAIFKRFFLTSKLILIPVESCNFGCAKASGFNDQKWVHMSYVDPFLIVEARGFGTAEIAAFNWNEYQVI